jgi:hypothetical protein
LELVVRRLAVNTLQAQVVLRELVRQSLTKQLEKGDLTAEERSELVVRLNKAKRDGETLRMILERAENGERFSD